MSFDNWRCPRFPAHGKHTHLGASRAQRHSVKLDIIFDGADERKAIMEQVRLRISPRLLLYSPMKEAMRDSELSGEVLKDLFGCAEESNENAQDHASKKSFPPADAFEKGAKVVNVLIAFTQAAASIVKKSTEKRSALSQNLKVVKDVNEYVKCVPIVSSVVQILIIATELAEMHTEMKRG